MSLLYHNPLSFNVSSVECRQKYRREEIEQKGKDLTSTAGYAYIVLYNSSCIWGRTTFLEIKNAKKNLPIGQDYGFKNIQKWLIPW